LTSPEDAEPNTKEGKGKGEGKGDLILQRTLSWDSSTACESSTLTCNQCVSQQGIETLDGSTQGEKSHGERGESIPLELKGIYANKGVERKTLVDKDLSLT